MQEVVPDLPSPDAKMYEVRGFLEDVEGPINVPGVSSTLTAPGATGPTTSTGSTSTAVPPASTTAALPPDISSSSTSTTAAPPPRGSKARRTLENIELNDLLAMFKEVQKRKIKACPGGMIRDGEDRCVHAGVPPNTGAVDEQDLRGVVGRGDGGWLVEGAEKREGKVIEREVWSGLEEGEE